MSEQELDGRASVCKIFIPYRMHLVVEKMSLLLFCVLLGKNSKHLFLKTDILDFESASLDAAVPQFRRSKLPLM